MNSDSADYLNPAYDSFTESKEHLNLFDFDGTLFRGDSFADFPIFAFGKLKFGIALLRSLPDLIKWKLGKISNSEAKERFFSRLYKGKSVADINEIAIRYSARIYDRLLPRASSRFFEALDKDEQVYIISASPQIWLQPWVDTVRHKYPDARLILLATIPETDCHGVLTGKFASPNCHGAEKVRRFLEFIAPDKDCESSRPFVRENFYITAHGDSSGDTEMFEFADKHYKY